MNCRLNGGVSWVSLWCECFCNSDGWIMCFMKEKDQVTKKTGQVLGKTRHIVLERHETWGQLLPLDPENMKNVLSQKTEFSVVYRPVQHSLLREEDIFVLGSLPKWAPPRGCDEIQAIGGASQVPAWLTIMSKTFQGELRTQGKAKRKNRAE